MTSARPIHRRFLVGLVPLLLALGALPLLAPTCGGGAEGYKVFARNSLIIPMDACYQSQTDDSSGVDAVGCSGSPEAGSVIRAYGLVYELIKHDIAVYWLIREGKAGATEVDLDIQYNGGWPVLKYQWGTNGASNPPGPLTEHAIHYRGAPFVVDGSDYTRAMNVLQNQDIIDRFGTAGASGDRTIPAVNVHVAQVAFRGFVRRTMAGGWNAGGNVAPKLALLEIGSGNIRSVNGSGLPTWIRDPKIAEPVIRGYLVEAGIGETGTAGGTATGTHGTIYDRLTFDDFLPTSNDDPRTSRLFTNGYEILWVPHWVAPGSCPDAFSAGSSWTSEAQCLEHVKSASDVQKVLRTIGAFVAAGHDVFAECAGLGSFDGTQSDTGTYSLDYKQGDPSTRFLSTTGMRINERQGSPAYNPYQWTSPFLQIGDYPFTPLGGAIYSYRPYAGYQPDVIRLITDRDQSNIDYFSVRPRVTGQTRGSIVYLGGHSYSGVQGDFRVSGSRLVLNTLFNLGNACSSSDVPCQTGLLGRCGTGEMRCDANGNLTCQQTLFPIAEQCNGVDDDCNGLVDDMDQTCYEGPSGTLGVGVCASGLRSCEYSNGKYAMGACNGQVRPSTEVCNGLDDDCDNVVDGSVKAGVTSYLQRDCYTGPSTSVDSAGVPMGICQEGRQTCNAGSWGTCAPCPQMCWTTCLSSAPPASCATSCVNCQILPQTEACTPASSTNVLDENCDGQFDEGTACGGCEPYARRDGCYSGSPGTLQGSCHAGYQICGESRKWGACQGQATPSVEVCSPASCVTDPTGPDCNKDEDCDGQIDEDCGCQVGETEDCYTGQDDVVFRAAGNASICQRGKRACESGEFSGACLGEIKPAPETCDGQDNDCDGVVDNGATCAGGFYCEHGVCVPDHCGVESTCPQGYDCDDTLASPRCVLGTCGGTTCADGEKCDYGQCKQLCPGPTEESICWSGAYCQSGGCVGGSCYYTGCKDAEGNDTGELCLEGTCQPDPCKDVVCRSGTFCRQGDCVQACTFVTCNAGQICGEDGFCEVDACADVLCDTGQKCEAGQCVPDPCAGKGCGAGQVCKDQVCVDDPCTGVVCPAGACLQGQCYATGNPVAGIYNPPASSSGSASGCNCQQGSAGSLSALLFLLLVPLARRRRLSKQGALFALLLSAGLAATACNKGGNTTFEPGSCGGGYTSCEGESQCIDVYTDPAHCGACGAACDAGEVCRDRICGPGSYVAPYITAVDPQSGDQGRIEPLTVTLTGQRFAEGATVRTVSSTGTDTLPTTYVNGTLQFALDLSKSASSRIYLRVVNPDNVISNSIAFDVVTPTPTITAVDPNPILAGADRVLHVCATGLLDDSLCHFKGTGIANEIHLDTTTTDPCLDAATAPAGACTGTSWTAACPGGSSARWCTVPATSLLPSTGYELWMVNQVDDTVLESTPHTPITISTQTPTLAELSPNQAEPSSVVSISLAGSSFDATSVVLWYSGGTETVIAPQLVDSTTLYIAQQQVGTVSAKVRVRNGNGNDIPYRYSHGDATPGAGLDFRIQSGLQRIASFSPSSGYQGQGITFTFGDPGGSLLIPGYMYAYVQLRAPGATTWTQLSGAMSGTQVTGARTFTKDDPIGEWQARLCFRSAAGTCAAADSTSAAYSFTLLSNQASLLSATPRSAKQGIASTSISMNVANLRGTPVVQFGQQPSQTFVVVSLLSGVATSGSTVTGNLDTRGLATGTYALRVVNPNANPSLPLSFNVTPGQPTLSSPLSPSCMVIADPPAGGKVITLNGTNFAQPDLQGNSGSTVHITMTGATGFEYVVPSTRNTSHALPYAIVESSTVMRVHLDPRDAAAGTYNVAVWNPGGLPENGYQQKSTTLVNAFTVSAGTCP